MADDGGSKTRSVQSVQPDPSGLGKIIRAFALLNVGDQQSGVLLKRCREIAPAAVQLSHERGVDSPPHDGRNVHRIVLLARRRRYAG